MTGCIYWTHSSGVTRRHVDLQAGNIGENVAVPIPTVDRGRGDPSKILGVIMDVTDKEQYKIAVKYGQSASGG